ncbi:deoxycytidylate deaminase [Alkaliphilus serpentinus]|uniref:Cytidine deaminase n=1 Tax=Alkaliphilus serpentinus TaxID=1482731 RepID=A0A833MAH5_9FIRM|nr:cytidine/deoxycytidylate deaminase family protein [Alkaliphilus serpentinus]KAB3530888.1 cytidine deaminase [Alkaliphilus serpentinus]
MRPSWDQYFMEMAEVVKTRATCLRRQVGAVIVKDKRILTSGYNGAPSGIPHCSKVGCLRDKLNIPSGQRHELCRGIHAEQNAIIQAALHGIKIEGSTIYVTAQPCILCAKILINAGITKVIYKGDYPDEFAASILVEAGIKLVKFDIEGI